jgi:hypothetical protein
MSHSGGNVNAKDSSAAREPRDSTIGRRSLLKRAGTAAVVGVGAAGAVSALAEPAQAAAGDTLVLGSANDAGTTATRLTATPTAAATLTLESFGTHAPLAIAPGTLLTNVGQMAGGELYNSNDDLFYVYPATGGAPASPTKVFNEFTAMQLVPIQPIRVLDTRTAAGRQLLDTNAIDTQGRLLGGLWTGLHLDGLADFFTAVVGNLTVTQPTAGGWLALSPAAAPGAGRPSTSSINFVKGQTVANGVTVAVDTNSLDVLLYSLVTTHVILDIVALNAPGPDWVAVPLATHASDLAAHLRAGHARKARRTSARGG